MERQKKVVDASIIVKWFSNEEGSNKAIELRNSHINETISLVAPELIILEVLNALRYKNLDENEIIKAGNDLINIQLDIFQINELLIKKIVKNSSDYNLSIYDSTYLSISQIYGCELVTENKKLLKTPNAVSLKEI